ncbi:MAG: hypothetical protein CM1200mP30_31190 [Pseudomonadota bacterium]|nr:MAG: hypothetical protein CM1200mP30_31190 [Pseudomonadota bacterium]
MLSISKLFLRSATLCRSLETKYDDPSGDLRRLREALEREWHLTNLRFGPGKLLSLQKELREGDWKVTVAVDYPGQVYRSKPRFKESFAVWPLIGFNHCCRAPLQFKDRRSAGIAGMMNPQIRFGEDLMSRVSYFNDASRWRCRNDKSYPWDHQ